MFIGHDDESLGSSGKADSNQSIPPNRAYSPVQTSWRVAPVNSAHCPCKRQLAGQDKTERIDQIVGFSPN
ncbi:MAG: hypothetical protein EBS61_00525 [Betaproteobacteria bacterium]|nr:hypothetical protein [Betaproteobacteria bacterium]